MRIVVGLGNPGPRYAHTRHNVGFRVVDGLALAHHIPLQEKKARSLIGQGKIRGEDVLLSKPETFMNRSGEAVSALLRWTGASPSDLVVILDDMDLDPGALRIRRRGSSGGHRGSTSIIEAIGTNHFPRVRIGIGHPRRGQDVTAYVLSPFSRDELEKIQEVTEKAVKAVEEIVAGDISGAMNRYNT